MAVETCRGDASENDATVVPCEAGFCCVSVGSDADWWWQSAGVELLKETGR